MRKRARTKEQESGLTGVLFRDYAKPCPECGRFVLVLTRCETCKAIVCGACFSIHNPEPHINRPWQKVGHIDPKEFERKRVA